MGGDAHSNSGYYEGGNVTNTLINAGEIKAKAFDFAEAGIFGGDSDYAAYGTVTNNIANTGSITAISWDGFAKAGLFGGDQTGDNETTMINTIVNTGTIYSWGDDGSTTEIHGGRNYSDNSEVVNNIFVDGTVDSADYTLIKGGSAHGDGGVTNNIVISGTVSAWDYAEVDGGNNHGNGAVTNNIVVTGTVNGDIIGGNNYHGDDNGGVGETTNTTILAGWSPTVDGTIYGDNNNNDTYGDPNDPKSPEDGGAFDRLLFEMQTTNEGQMDDWKAAINQLKAENGGTLPNTGHITWGDKTYYWQNIDELEDLVKFILNVTWFNPNDGRYNGQPADRIVIYCHADKNNLGVLLVNNDSKGNIGTSFDISKLETLGKGGTTVSFGSEGTLSIMMDAQGNGYAAWNGGVEGANGAGDFAKMFACPLPQ